MRIFALNYCLILSFATMHVAIIGGGAAGFFAAIRIKELQPLADVTIFERSNRVLRKVEVSGGGRCNCTNTFAHVRDLQQVYPRGHKLLKRLFRQFGPQEAREWFEAHGVPLVVQEDQCIFPKAQDSHAIIDCFMRECQPHGISIRTGIDGFEECNKLKHKYNRIVIATGGISPAVQQALQLQGGVAAEDFVPPLPSLFTFNIKDEALTSLMGTVVEGVITSIPGTKYQGEGPLLITHWGMSGPAILKLSAHAARELAEHQYRMPLAVRWSGRESQQSLEEWLGWAAEEYAQRLVVNVSHPALPSRLWEYLLQRAGIPAERRWSELGKKQRNRLLEVITNDQYQIAGRCHYKEEFVTSGGVRLSAINKTTLESLRTENAAPHLYFAGEVLDIDGVTGGFNLQAAWTTADAVAHAIAAAAASTEK